jgi:hypothetical protein
VPLILQAQPIRPRPSRDDLEAKVCAVLLNEAIRDGNTWRVLAIFRAFMAQHLPPGERPRRVAAQQQRVYSRQEIARLYSQHHKGAYKGREAEWQALERDIIAAGAQGRILNPVDVAGK